MFNLKPYYNISLNFFLRYLSYQIGDKKGINVVKREIPIIVSLTSVEDNFMDLELTIFSILNQSVSPDKMILWLSNKYKLSELPYNITRFIKNGLDIRFIEDKGKYNNIINALKEFNDSIIVATEDNIIYPKDWLKKLYHSYIANPQDIHAHRAFGVKTEQAGISSVTKWIKYVNKESSEYSNFAILEGGMLFPPKCFAKEIFREDIYNNKNTPITADIWIWFMAVISDRKIRVVKNHIEVLPCTNIFKKIFNKNDNKSDEEIKYLMNFYKQNILNKLK